MEKYICNMVQELRKTVRNSSIGIWGKDYDRNVVVFFRAVISE